MLAIDHNRFLTIGHDFNLGDGRLNIFTPSAGLTAV